MAYLDQELCTVYREANILFPQVEIGIVPMCADLMLRKGPDYLCDALRLGFSDDQLAWIEQGMNRAHSRRGIPALGPDVAAGASESGLPKPVVVPRVVTRERLRVVWANIVHYTIDAIVDCVTISDAASHLSSQCATADYDVLRVQLPNLFAAKPLLLGDVSAVMATTARVLATPEVRRLALEFRRSLDFADVPAGRRALVTARRQLHEAIAAILVAALTAAHPNYAALAEGRRWRIFQPLTE
jgi:hypothetical protein